MDIPSLSIAVSSRNVSTQVSLSVMKMALDQMEETGNMLNEMLDASYVDMGSVIDIRI